MKNSGHGFAPNPSLNALDIKPLDDPRSGRTARDGLCQAPCVLAEVASGVWVLLGGFLGVLLKDHGGLSCAFCFLVVIRRSVFWVSRLSFSGLRLPSVEGGRCEESDQALGAFEDF